MRVPALVVFAAFLKLGLTSFGGPIAHLGYFQRDLVQRRGWLSAADYGEIVALSQFLPGPASSQTGFAIGLRLAGLPGALAAFTGFTLPSAALMLVAAFWLQAIPASLFDPAAHGLKLVAVAVVAHAVFAMARDHLRRLAHTVLALITLAGLLLVREPAATPAIILVAALVGALLAPASADSHPPPPTLPAPLRPAILIVAIFAALLLALPVIRVLTDAPAAFTADAFYRSGALVFGGGHVVLPLLQSETAGMVSDDAFLAGYGAAQLLPGPLFAFAAYLGALAAPSPPDLALGLIALGAIFLPGFLLILAADRLWSRLRHGRRARGAIGFANAAVIGVLAAALIDPVASSALTGLADLLIAAIGFALLASRRAPVVAVVALVATAGAFAYIWL